MIRLILLLCLLATPAHALFFSGTVTGKVTTRDTRADPYVAAGYGAATGGINGNRVHFRQANKFSSATIAVPEALVEVCVILVGNTSCDPQWTRTNSVGDYSVDWWGFTSAVAIFVKVYAIRPQLLEGEVVFSDEIPPHEFRVTTAGFEAVTIGQDQRISPTASLGDTQNISINTAPAAQEVVNTFLTVRETYAMLSTQTEPKVGGRIRSDMQGLDIFANSIFDGNQAGGLAFFEDEVWLIPGTGTSKPFSVAHELGHITAWRAMDWHTAPYEFSVYSYGNDWTLGWSDTSNEFERAAFWEGFAHSVAAMWMWNSNATPVGGCGGPGIPRNGGCFSLENAGTECAAGVPGHRRAICVAKAFWDILDDPPGDTDKLTWRDFGEIITVFRKQYPRFCVPFFDNGCRDEGGHDDNNWEDYQRNHLLEYPNDGAELRSIELSNRINGGNNG